MFEQLILTSIPYFFPSSNLLTRIEMYNNMFIHLIYKLPLSSWKSKIRVVSYFF